MQGPIRFITAFLLCILVPCSTFAAGFSIFEAGAKALGMGGAFTAQASDPSAVFFNPAGVSDLPGTQVYFGTSLIFTGTEFAGVDPDPGYGVKEQTGTLFFPPINAYITHEIREGLGIGFGIYNAFGLGQTWENPDAFSGRHISYEVDLQTFYFNPVLAWRPSDVFSFGVGLQLVHTRVKLHQRSQRWDPNGSGFVDVADVTLEGSSSVDVGANVGVKVAAGENLDVGITARSKVTGKAEGDATFEQILSGNPAFDPVVASQLPPNQGVGVDVKLPWFIGFAIAYSGVDKWIFEADVNTFGWSEFDELTFKFDDSTLDTTRPQNYENTVSIRTGAQYSVNEEFDLRAGYYWDPSPQPEESMSPLLGDSDRHGVSVGFGFGRGSFVVDAFALFLIPEERSTDGKSLDDYNGTYASFGSLVGANLGFNW